MTGPSAGQNTRAQVGHSRLSRAGLPRVKSDPPSMGPFSAVVDTCRPAGAVRLDEQLPDVKDRASSPNRGGRVGGPLSAIRPAIWTRGWSSTPPRVQKPARWCPFCRTRSRRRPAGRVIDQGVPKVIADALHLLPLPVISRRSSDQRAPNDRYLRGLNRPWSDRFKGWGGWTPASPGGGALPLAHTKRRLNDSQTSPLRTAHRLQAHRGRRQPRLSEDPPQWLTQRAGRTSPPSSPARLACRNTSIVTDSPR
jgi:hypothetical protein